MQAQRNTGRRSYGTGSLYIHEDGNGRETWYGRWRVGDRRVNRRVGPKREKGSSDGLTRPQAERELRKLMETEIPVSTGSRMTLEKAGQRYIAHVESRGRKKTTIDDYKGYLRVQLVPHFGTKPVEQISPEDVERFIAAKLKDGRSPKSVVNWINFLQAILGYAQKRRWIVGENPCKLVDKPRVTGTDPDIHFLEPEEVGALIKAVPDDDLGRVERVLYLVAAHTGLRQSEVLALRWRDIDWPAIRVRVRQRYVRGNFDTPKSRRSSRSVPLTDRVAAELERLFQASAYQADDALVFGHPTLGTPLDASKVLKRFKDALEAAEVRALRFHDLRHTFAVRCAAAGVPMRTLMEWMGHRDFKTTLIYADYAPSAHEAALVERAFSSVHSSVQTEQNSDDLHVT
jgi:integrase